MIENNKQSWLFEVFYDGKCPICTREIDFLKRRDKAEQVRFTDFTHHDFNPSEIGKTTDQLNSKIHGRLPDGTLIFGIEVFRQLYSAIGWKSIVSISRLPGFSHLLEFGYSIFSRNRLRLTGRKSDSCSGETCSSGTKSAGHPS